MYIVTKHIDFCYGHRLLNYEGKCRYLHGHNARVELDLMAEQLDARGMVRDFTDIKQVIKTWIDQTLDHTMLLNRADPLVPILQREGERFYLMDDNPTAENIAKLIYREAHARGMPVVAVRLWETPTSCAMYRP